MPRETAAAIRAYLDASRQSLAQLIARGAGGSGSRAASKGNDRTLPPELTNSPTARQGLAIDTSPSAVERSICSAKRGGVRSVCHSRSRDRSESDLGAPDPTLA
ncbi:hypothetical protein EVAR_56201_1 [Eumeta japonica]|uniref:Uncharacterized protein n=1 Tax=Eumeta variegata TaxID=151549 RepID=A0A4C1Y812_EUMVA|nr:hypothetical protein EVAR_56201_1 [Eumeta japonica]